jgi:hypothetical protein
MANTYLQKRTADTFSKPARNDFPNMPPPMGLGFHWKLVFYKYIAPTALRININERGLSRVALVTGSAVGATYL